MGHFSFFIQYGVYDCSCNGISVGFSTFHFGATLFGGGEYAGCILCCSGKHGVQPTTRSNRCGLVDYDGLGGEVEEDYDMNAFVGGDDPYLLEFDIADIH